MVAPIEAQTRTKAESEPYPDPPTTIANGADRQLPNSSVTPKKLTSRPRKIRKISPTSTTEERPQNPTPNVQSLIPRIIPRSLSSAGEVYAALRYLRTSDPLLSPLIDLHPSPIFEEFKTPFLALSRSILFQQLAHKAGTSIYTRFVSLCGDESNVLPHIVLDLTPQQLRQIGVSGRKASYLHDLAKKYQNGILSDKLILEMDDKSLFTMLTMVNGIGSWSVHTFMIFSLHRPDVLPIHDLGIRKGVQMLYGLEELPKPSQMDQLCEKWRPYRSVASWYIWRFLEAKGPNFGPPAAAVDANLNLQQQPAVLLQQQHHQHHQNQHQQFVDPITESLDLGACAWGQ